MNLKHSRRKFLAAASGSALALPFLRALPGYGQEQEKRYVIFAFSGNGRVRHTWGADKLGPERGNLQFRRTLTALQPYKDYVTVVTGLQNGVARAIAGTHEGGMGTLWTGLEGMNVGASIDQLIGRQCGGGLRPTLEFRVISNEDELTRTPNNRMIFDDAGTPIDPRDNPVTAAEQLFMNVGTMPDPAVERAKLMRREVFTRLDQELGALKPRLCSEDQVHIDALRAGWNQVQTQLNGAVGASCMRPNLTVDNGNYFRERSRQTIEVMLMAMVCDMTRVASLQWSQARSDLLATWAGVADRHHDASHAVPNSEQLVEYQPYPIDKHVNRADTPTEAWLTQYAPIWEKMIVLESFYAEEFAYLLKRLSEYPVAGGKTMLDQTLVIWGSEVDNGSSHDHWNLPFILAGGAAGKLNRGTVINYPTGFAVGAEANRTPPGTRYHNDLLVTIAQMAGCTGLSTIGPARFNQGPLVELIATT